MTRIELTKHDKDTTGASWVAGILPKNDTRYHMTHIMVSDLDDVSQMVATNGAALYHFRTKVHYEPGYYEVIKRTKSLVTMIWDRDLDEVSFPDWADLFKADNGAHWYGALPKADCRVTLSTGYADIVRALPKNRLLDFGVFQSAMGLSGIYTAHVWDKKGEKPIELRNTEQRCKAVVMPIADKRY